MTKLSILIATQGRRDTQFKSLVEDLGYQSKPFADEIEIVAFWNNGEWEIGELRQMLMEEAKGEYVCFIDDDDAVPHYYCAELMKALGKDYVGFKVQVFNDGVEQPMAYHDLQYQVWTEDENGFYRGVTHLNPLRRKIALQGKFTTDGAGEDGAWARVVTPLAKDQVYLDKVMYFYYHSKRDTSFGGRRKGRQLPYGRPSFKFKNFRWHPSSKKDNKELRK